MKKILVVSALAAIGLNTLALAGDLPETMPTAPLAAVAASEAGIYLGVAGGWGITNWKEVEKVNASAVPTQEPTITKDNGFVGRVFLGYDFNKYLAIELGYSHFFTQAKMFYQSIEQYKIKTQSFDLMGKIKAPIADNFNLYAKLGMGYLISSFEKTGTDGDAAYWNLNRKNYRPAYGMGVDYKITTNIIAHIEWLRLNGKTRLSTDASEMDKEYQPHTDTFMLGLKYKFIL